MKTTTANAAPAAISMAIMGDRLPRTRTAAWASNPSATRSSPMARLAFTSTASPVRTIGATSVIASAASATTRVSAPPAAGGRGDGRAPRTDTDHEIEAECGRTLPHHTVRIVVVRSEFAHVADHGDTPRVAREIQAGQRDQRRFHRRGVGVVRIVEHGHAGVGLEQLHAPAAGLRLRELERDLFVRHGEDLVRNHHRHRRVLHLVGPVQRDREPLPAEHERRTEPIVDRHVDELTVGVGAGPDRHDRRERRRPQFRGGGVVGVQHRGTRTRERLEELGEHGDHAGATAEVLGVREPDVRDDPGVGARNIAQLP